MWAVVPVKQLDRAKQRLAQDLAPDARHQLCKAMLQDVLITLSASPEIEGTIVVSNDPEVAAVAAEFRCDLLTECELGARGLNGITSAAVHRLAASGIEDVLIAHGDLPMLCGEDVSDLSRAHAAAGGRAVTIATDRHRSGSNCIMATPARRLDFRFGENSLARHITGARQAGMKCTVLILPGASLDIDTAEDLAALRNVIDQHRDTRTARCLRAFEPQAPQSAPANGLPQGLGSPAALNRSG